MTRYFKEDFDPAIYNSEGAISIENPNVVDSINANLDASTRCSFITPYVALEKVRKILAYYKIFIPGTTSLAQNHGNEVFEVSQFGMKVGMKDNGEVVTTHDSPYVLYFEWSLDEKGMYDIFASIVNHEDLEEILNDYDAEVEDDETDLHEEHSIGDHTKTLYRIVNASRASKHNNDVVDYVEHEKQGKTFTQVNEAKMPKFDHEGPKGAVHIKKNVETGEHVIRFWKKTNDGYKRHEPADYFTDDREDAKETAKKMVNESVMPNLKKKFSSEMANKAVTLSKRMQEEGYESKEAERNWKRTKLHLKAGQSSFEKLNAGDLKGAKKKLAMMKRLGKKLSEPDKLDEVSKEWLSKKGSRGFDLAHSYRWKDNYKRAQKKIDQIDMIRSYMSKKGLNKPSEPAKEKEPDELQKRYNELGYKGD